MTVALWCILIAIFLPYLCTGIAKASGRYNLKDNHDPGIFSSRSMVLVVAHTRRN